MQEIASKREIMKKTEENLTNLQSSYDLLHTDFKYWIHQITIKMFNIELNDYFSFSFLF